MSSQIVLNLKESLEKELDIGSVDDANGLERVNDILDRLNDVNMTLDILTDTLIGATVNKVKKKYTSCTKITVQAKKLVQKWKSSVVAQKQPDDTTTKKKNGTTVMNDQSESTLGDSIKESGKVKKNGKAKRAQQDEEEDNDDDDDDVDYTEEVQTIIPENEWAVLSPQRKSICEKIYETLLQNEKELVIAGVNKKAIVNLIAPRAAEIENAIYKYCKNDKKMYQDKSRSIVFNMKRNKRLCVDVSIGSIDVHDLASYSAEQLADSVALAQRASVAQKLIDSKRLDWDMANEDKINKQCGITGDLLKASLFTCSRCKSIKTTSTQKQTRSADEPMTVFVLCLNCGKRWKC